MTWLPAPTASWQHIAVEVCRQYDLPWKDLMNHSRFQDHIWVRYKVWRRLRDELGMTYQQIGRLFGYHHASVMYGCGWRRKG